MTTTTDVDRARLKVTAYLMATSLAFAASCRQAPPYSGRLVEVQTNAPAEATLLLWHDGTQILLNDTELGTPDDLSASMRPDTPAHSAYLLLLNEQEQRALMFGKPVPLEIGMAVDSNSDAFAALLHAVTNVAPGVLAIT